MNKQIVTFIDQIGRTIIGELVKEAPTGDKAGDNEFIVKNPAIIHVQPTQQGQLNVQTIPLYFRDFVSDKNKEEGTFWKYNYSTVVLGLNIENDPRLVDQYEKIFIAPPVIQPVNAPQAGDKTIKLFDD
jgi:hypothetical protein